MKTEYWDLGNSWEDCNACYRTIIPYPFFPLIIALQQTSFLILSSTLFLHAFPSRLPFSSICLFFLSVSFDKTCEAMVERQMWEILDQLDAAT